MAYKSSLKNPAALIDFYVVRRIILVCRGDLLRLPEWHLAKKTWRMACLGKKKAKGRKRR